MPVADLRVTDQAGRPVPAASVTPYPIRFFNSNLSNRRGEVKVYQIDEGTRQFRVAAEGYESKTIAFPGRGRSALVILKRL
jgi:hypothetical protein